MTVPNLWTVHPRLEPFSPPGLAGECVTCYAPVPARAEEKARRRPHRAGRIAQGPRLQTRSSAAFQIDGSMGALSGIQEMLLQSREAEVSLLPALPSAWMIGSVSGLRTRAGVVVNMVWEKGFLTSASLEVTRALTTLAIWLPPDQDPRGMQARISRGAGKRHSEETILKGVARGFQVDGRLEQGDVVNIKVSHFRGQEEQPVMVAAA
jgi:hypothetical protein